MDLRVIAANFESRLKFIRVLPQVIYHEYAQKSHLVAAAFAALCRGIDPGTSYEIHVNG